MLSLLCITKRMISYILFESSIHPSLPAYSKALEIVKNFRAIPDGNQYLMEANCLLCGDFWAPSQ